MSDLVFVTDAVAAGQRRDREGTITVDGERIHYAAPAAMGGKGVGASPESLLISAVTACYSLTLLYYLQQENLPVREVAIHTEGVVVDHPAHDRYSKITVSPSIRGGVPDRDSDYQAVARAARDNCFIGQTVAAGGVSYEVGSVTVAA